MARPVPRRPVRNDVGKLRRKPRGRAGRHKRLSVSAEFRIHEVFVCDQIVHDSITKKFTIHGLFDRINSEKFPAVHPSFGVFFRYGGNVGDHSVILILQGPDGKSIGTDTELTATIPKENPDAVANYAYVALGVPLMSEGKYSIFLKDKSGRVIGSTHFTAARKSVGDKPS